MIVKTAAKLGMYALDNVTMSAARHALMVPATSPAPFLVIHAWSGVRGRVVTFLALPLVEW